MNGYGYRFAVHLIDENAIIPSIATEYSACFDIYSCLHTEGIIATDLKGSRETLTVRNREVIIPPKWVALIPTGIHFIMPENYSLRIYSRSGNSLKKRLVVYNVPGVIDADYTNETFVMVKNDTTLPRLVLSGEAIAQGEFVEKTKSFCGFMKIDDKAFEIYKDEMMKQSSRRGGFGSTS